MMKLVNGDQFNQKIFPTDLFSQCISYENYNQFVKFYSLKFCECFVCQISSDFSMVNVMHYTVFGSKSIYVLG